MKSSPSRGYITASKTSTQLNCKFKHPLGDSSRGAHHFAAGIVCFLYVCLCVSVWVLILLMCCGLQSEYNCSARCHLISSSWPADTLILQTSAPKQFSYHFTRLQTCALKDYKHELGGNKRIESVFMGLPAKSKAVVDQYPASTELHTQ